MYSSTLEFLCLAFCAESLPLDSERDLLFFFLSTYFYTFYLSVAARSFSSLSFRVEAKSTFFFSSYSFFFLSWLICYCNLLLSASFSSVSDARGFIKGLL